MDNTPPPGDAPDLAPGLYIVATPIGNLGDITLRAIATLRGVGAVACEDTRVTGRLLAHLGIKQRLLRHDDHADDRARAGLISLMAETAVALVSDAGTPLVSDPGYRLVRDCRAAGVPVTTIPGACAAVAAVTLSGLPSDRFLFAGFLPAKAAARDRALGELAGVPASLVLYETGPRLVDTLRAIAEVLTGREVAVAREITKLYEECRLAAPEDLAAHYEAHPPRGEIALVIAPPLPPAAVGIDQAEVLLRAELAVSSPSQAAGKVAKATGLDRKALYALAMTLK